MWLPGFDFFHLLMKQNKKMHTHTPTHTRTQKKENLEKKQTHTAQVKNVTTRISFLWSFTDAKKQHKEKMWLTWFHFFSPSFADEKLLVVWKGGPT